MLCEHCQTFAVAHQTLCHMCHQRRRAFNAGYHQGLYDVIHIMELERSVRYAHADYPIDVYDEGYTAGRAEYVSRCAVIDEAMRAAKRSLEYTMNSTEAYAAFREANDREHAPCHT